ncbi:MAG: murein DD-endopeptidase MepM/ murein hydrolase activator NlpD [Halieaceae bacterium]|jgi:murein DD-endopeptidase MepM/ murein hydrolase activator NlpD
MARPRAYKKGDNDTTQHFNCKRKILTVGMFRSFIYLHPTNRIIRDMSATNKPRGATAVSDQNRGVQRKHLLVVGLLSACIALATMITPSGKVEANKPPTIAEDAGLAETESAISKVLSATAAPAFPAETPPELRWTELTVRSGDNLSLLFKRAGFSDRELHQIVSTVEDGKALAKIYPRQTIGFQLTEGGELAAVRHRISALESVTYDRTKAGFESKRVVLKPEVRQAWTTATIESSLFMAGQDAGLSHNLIMELANIFGGVIDFILDPRQGDTIYLVYEELYLEGEKLRDGNILAAAFINQGETFYAYSYTDQSGYPGFYNEQGVSMRKAFLMAPLDFTRVSSNFNLRRKHPIYKTTRPHRGTDYAAPTGTPVFAAGDGRVVKAGYTSANGNYLFIQHGEQYVTKYLHLHKRKVKQGQRVSQSQVIGTVGATGAATGPHLHYEFLVNGVHRDPRTIHKQLPKAKALAAGEMPSFKRAIVKASQQLASLQTDSTLALNESTGTP